MVQYFPIVTGSLTVTGSVNVSGSITTNSTITATTLVVQTITSSISSITGSTNFGTSLANTHSFTGSVSMTGSLAVVTNGTELQVTNTGVNIGNALTDSHVISGSVRINPNGLFISSSGNVGIGTATPFGTFNVVAGTNKSLIIQDSGIADTIEIASYSTSGGTRAIAMNGSVLTFGTGTAGGGSATPRLTINASGNIGIGTSSPATYTIAPQLVVDSGASGGGLTIKTGTTSSTTNYGGVFFADGTTGSEQYRGFIQYNHNFNTLSDTLILGTAGTERMYITSAGNVGIGASNITGKLMLYQGTAGNVFQSIVSNQGGSTRVGINLNPSMNESDAAAYQAQSAIYATDFNYSANIIFATKTEGAYGNSLTERARITSGGYFKASVDGTYLSSGAYHEMRSNAIGNLLVLQQTASSGTLYGIDVYYTAQAPNNTSSTFITFYDNVNTKAIIYSNGTFGSRTSTYGGISDIKLKENITPSTPKLDKLMQVNVVNYNFIDDAKKEKQLGVISQELENIFPGMVFESEDKETGEKYKNVKYSIFVPMLVKAIQELNTKFEEYKATHP